MQQGKESRDTEGWCGDPFPGGDLQGLVKLLASFPHVWELHTYQHLSVVSPISQIKCWHLISFKSLYKKQLYKNIHVNRM